MEGLPIRKSTEASAEFPSNYVEEEEEEVVNPVVSETHDAHGDSTAVDVLDNLMAY